MRILVTDIPFGKNIVGGKGVRQLLGFNLS
jgi:hypothetical protein